jgi:hypothetical protein
VDAPQHSSAGGKRIADYHLSELVFSRPSVLDVPLIDNQLIEPQRLEPAPGSAARDTELILLRSIFGRFRADEQRYVGRSPGFPPEAAAPLMERFLHLRAPAVDFIPISSAAHEAVDSGVCRASRNQRPRNRKPLPDNHASMASANIVQGATAPRITLVGRSEYPEFESRWNAMFPLCTSFHKLPDAAQFSEIAGFARLFDTPFLFVYSRQMSSGLLPDEAEDEGKTAIGGEFGAGEGVSSEGVRHAYEGSLNVMRHYGLLASPVRPIASQQHQQRLVQASDLADHRPGPRDGIWEPLAE